MKPTQPQPPMRDQLVAAEASITDQLWRLRNPVAMVPSWAAPDNRALIATLEAELEEIQQALGKEHRQG